MPKRDSGVRLTELLVALSLATDLGFGQPAEHMARAARIALRIGDRLGLSTNELATLYDVSILTYVGCPTYGNEAATLFGDDIDFRANAVHVDLAGMPARRFMMSRAVGTQKAVLMATNGRGVIEQMASHCSAAGELATRLGLSDDVCAGVQQAYARWDGKGVPSDLEGDALSLAARIAHIAEACEVYLRDFGIAGAVEMIQARSGTQFDPALTATAVPDPEGLFKGIDEDTVDEIIDAEPVERPPLTDDQLDAALEAIGDFCDLRCPFFVGHSGGTAALVAAACEALNVPAAEARVARRAALVHDVGRFGVPASVWSKSGPLTSREEERMRMHVYYVERIFSRPEPLKRVGLLAATHHERTDGSGYHRGVSGALLSVPARVLAAADAYHAMTQDRPYRPALTPEDAARELKRGAFDPIAVDAVLAAAGQTSSSRTRSGGPAGLTARETDVLALLARGLANKAIAKELSISPKTVGNHIERIYTKLDVTNRAAAAMRAMQYGIVDALQPDGEPYSLTSFSVRLAARLTTKPPAIPRMPRMPPSGDTARKPNGTTTAPPMISTTPPATLNGTAARCPAYHAASLRVVAVVRQPRPDPGVTRPWRRPSRQLEQEDAEAQQHHRGTAFHPAYRTQVRIQPLTGVLGAEITDVDLAKELTTPAIEGVAAEVTAALDQHLVVIIKEQNLSPGEQTEFTHHFGPPCETPFVGTLPDYSEVIKVLKEADEANAFNFGGAWHSDFSFLERPPSYTLLHAIDVPAYGGDTLWTSNIAALDQLPAHYRDPIDKPAANGVHTAKDAYSPKMQAMHDGLKHMDIQTTEDANDVRTHPIITTHPGNKKQVLFFNLAYVRDLEGTDVAPDNTPAFLLALHRHSTDHALTVRHRWRNGDLAIWDNRATQHLALNDYGGFRRELHRTTVQGGIPSRESPTL